MYIDPAAGSLILQMLAAGVLSAFALTKNVRIAVKAWFANLTRRQRSE